MTTKPIAEDTINGSPRRFAGGPYVLAIVAVIGSALLRLAVDSLARDEAPLLIFAFGVAIRWFPRGHHRDCSEHPCFRLPFRSTSLHLLRS
jgi:hypothetical protein